MKPVSRRFMNKLLAIQPLAARDLQHMDRSVVVADPDREPPLHHCYKCGEDYPRTPEFFYRGSDGNFNSPCRACINEQKQQASAVKPCAVAGCTNPRHRSKNGRYTSYCTEHLYAKRRKAG